MDTMRREYSFCALTRNLGDSTDSKTNPFTGGSVEICIDEGLTANELAVLKSVFDANAIVGPEPEFEGYAKCWADGDSIRFRGFEFDSGQIVTSIWVGIVCMELTEEMLSILFRVGKSGNLALASSAIEHVCVIGCEPTEKQLARWGDVRMLYVEEDVRDWLDNTIGFREVSFCLSNNTSRR